MPEMPFAIAKGRLLAAMDARYSYLAGGSAAERISVLNALRAPLTPSGGYYPTLAGTLDKLAWTNPGEAPGSAAHLKAHLNEDWFGFKVDRVPAVPPAIGNPKPSSHGDAIGLQPGYTPGQWTGWWRNWYGDA
ncbi:MAG: hypothetical protein U0360_07925 [Dehalococcoidia bacterium]